MEKLSIKQIPCEDRPYEKFEEKGAKSLTDAELLSIIIKSGSKGFNSLDIARYILSDHPNGLSGFDYLNEVSLDELKQIPGVGRVKAIQLKSIMELATRINFKINNKLNVKIKCPKDVYSLVAKDMKDKKQEEVRVILLDSKCNLKSVVIVSLGAVNKSAVSPKEILSEPIKQMATSIILVHNHPSGDTMPSRQDILLTRKINDYANLFEITLADHIIIGKNGYTSMKEVNSELFIGGRIL